MKIQFAWNAANGNQNINKYLIYIYNFVVILIVVMEPCALYLLRIKDSTKNKIIEMRREKKTGKTDVRRKSAKLYYI